MGKKKNKKQHSNVYRKHLAGKTSLLSTDDGVFLGHQGLNLGQMLHIKHVKPQVSLCHHFAPSSYFIIDPSVPILEEFSTNALTGLLIESADVLV